MYSTFRRFTGRATPRNSSSAAARVNLACSSQHRLFSSPKVPFSVPFSVPLSVPFSPAAPAPTPFLSPSASPSSLADPATLFFPLARTPRRPAPESGGSCSSQKVLNHSRHVCVLAVILQ